MSRRPAAAAFKVAPTAMVSPADKDRAADYDNGPYAGIMPFGKHPFLTYIDPSRDGCEIVNGVAGRVRAEMFRRIGLEDLLRAQVKAGAAS
ncbi:MAG TPA: hypothetical protein VGV14_01375 [Rhodanobacter sp.]|nr:hypothetical protein [Rhodanobacter sp.]